MNTTDPDTLAPEVPEAPARAVATVDLLTEPTAEECVEEYAR